jgi:hypothetical protein
MAADVHTGQTESAVASTAPPTANGVHPNMLYSDVTALRNFQANVDADLVFQQRITYATCVKQEIFEVQFKI